jgi:hypothetical protein
MRPRAAIHARVENLTDVYIRLQGSRDFPLMARCRLKPNGRHVRSREFGSQTIAFPDVSHRDANCVPGARGLELPNVVLQK